MAEVEDWSTTAGSNNSASPEGLPEGMAPSGVNNSVRENMAKVKRWYNDISGTITTGGSANAQTLAASRTISAYAAGQAFLFEAGFANTGSCTLNVDSVGAKTIKKNYNENLVSGDILAGQMVHVVYDAGDDVFQMVSPSSLDSSKVDLISNGTLSSASSLDITGLDSSTYKLYKILLWGLVPSSDPSAPELYFSNDNGSTFETSGYQWAYNQVNNSGSDVVAGSSSDSSITMCGAIGGSAGEKSTLEISIMQFNETGEGVRAHGMGCRINGSTGILSLNFAGSCSATDCDAVRVQFATGNISGEYAVYGYK